MPADVVSEVLGVSGFSELNPAQRLAVESGLLEGRNLVVAAPTASGKTLISEIAALNAIRQGKKVVYIVPLRALASEKYDEFREKYEPLGIKVAMSIGDMDSSDSWLASYDMIIATSEKLDSLLRHGVSWINEVGLLVADEIHLIDSPDRGPTLEVILTRLRQFVKPQMLALSATISNHGELAEWLDAKAVKSDYRPISLYRGICYDGDVSFVPQKSISLNPEQPALREIVRDTLEMGKQALVFLSTRRSAESTAEKLGKFVSKSAAHDTAALEKLAGRIERTLERPTRQCSRLAGCVRNGTAFHHAGLTSKQRKLIETAFREGTVKVITATPTLAAGINMPAFRTVVNDLKRFSSFRGMSWLPILEVEQMMGRAGRPKYDTEGQAILMPKNKGEAHYAWDNYINGEPENIHSKLGVEPVLRVHVLSLIASDVTRTKEELFEFFSKTFYAFQYKDMSQLKGKLEKVIEMLRSFGFIAAGPGGQAAEGGFRTGSQVMEEGKEALSATRLGRRVSELYIDPLTAHGLIQSLKKVHEKGTDDFGLLHIIANTIEMKPLLNIRKGDFEGLNDLLAKEEPMLVEKPPQQWDPDYDEYLKSIKTARMLLSWAEESSEEEILNELSVTPGELRARLERADWLLYSSQELGLLSRFMEILNDIRKMRIRMKYGVREELLALVRLKGIGRVKARALHSSGIKGVSDLKKAPLQSLERIIGKKTAASIKEQVGSQ
jgi:helicase